MRVGCSLASRVYIDDFGIGMLGVNRIVAG
jgi:hypothetical protein